MKSLVPSTLFLVMALLCSERSAAYTALEHGDALSYLLPGQYWGLGSPFHFFDADDDIIPELEVVGERLPPFSGFVEIPNVYQHLNNLCIASVGGVATFIGKIPGGILGLAAGYAGCPYWVNGLAEAVESEAGAPKETLECVLVGWATGGPISGYYPVCAPPAP